MYENDIKRKNKEIGKEAERENICRKGNKTESKKE
jgi:hypothetical protein